MRALLQRVRRARVTVGGDVVGAIGLGLVVLLGVERGDTADDARALAERIPNLRLFSDPQGKLNLSLRQVGGEILVVSQFTLLADLSRGLRPSFEQAAAPALAEELYNVLVAALRSGGTAVATGIFRADMDLELCNQGPVTVALDTRRG